MWIQLKFDIPWELGAGEWGIVVTYTRYEELVNCRQWATENLVGLEPWIPNPFLTTPLSSLKPECFCLWVGFHLLRTKWDYVLICSVYSYFLSISTVSLLVSLSTDIIYCLVTFVSPTIKRMWPRKRQDIKF